MKRIAIICIAMMLSLCGCAEEQHDNDAHHDEEVVFEVSDSSIKVQADVEDEPECEPEYEQEQEQPYYEETCSEPEESCDEEYEEPIYEEDLSSDLSSDWYGDINGHPTKEYFQYAGIITDHRFTYTWYSSRVLRHKDIGEWHTDSQGYWRNVDGYLVVASCDYEYGTTLSTDMFGPMIVLDYCGTSGVIDVYVNW